MTQNTIRSREHNICVTSVPESQILVRFALRPAVSMILHILQFPIDSYVKRPKQEAQGPWRSTWTEDLVHKNAGMFWNFE